MQKFGKAEDYRRDNTEKQKQVKQSIPLAGALGVIVETVVQVMLERNSFIKVHL